MNEGKELTQDEANQFKIAWDNNDRDALFVLCNIVRQRWQMKEYTRDNFDHGWQCRVVLHPILREALLEFFNLCYGWW